MSEYTKQVKAILAGVELPAGVECTSYNTGFGLSLAPEIGGPEVCTLAVKAVELAKVPPPPSGPNWNREWATAKRMTAAFLAKHNATLKLAGEAP